MAEKQTLGTVLVTVVADAGVLLRAIGHTQLFGLAAIDDSTRQYTPYRVVMMQTAKQLQHSLSKLVDALDAQSLETKVT